MSPLANPLSPRASTVAAIKGFQVVEGDVVFELEGLEKTSRPGNVRGEVRCPGGAGHPGLSLIDCLNEYQSRTEVKREYFASAEGAPPDRLFISHTKPYQSVQPCTLAKWLLAAMDRAGIDTSSYRAHSVRSAGASAMLRQGMSLQQVLQRANWSPTSRTFAVFYDRS